MPSASHRPPQRALERLIARADRLLERARQVSSNFSRWRVVIFLTGVVCSVVPYKLGWFDLGNAALGVFFVIFMIVARYHNRLEDRMHRVRLWRKIKRVNLARSRSEWSGIPERTIPASADHPYAADLDIIGSCSLLRMLDTTISSIGRDRLASWLLDQPPERTNWQSRQSLAKELAHLPLFRDRLALEASLIDETEIDGHRIRASLQTTASFPGLGPLLVIQSILAASTLALVLLYLITNLPGYWVLSFTIYAAVFILTLGRSASVFSQALSQHRELDKLGAVFGYLEHRRYTTTPYLAQLCEPLIRGDRRPSQYIRRLARIFHALSIRAHPLVHLTLNALCPWDLFFTDRLERVRKDVLSEVPVWLDTLANLEAATALGTFAFLNPDYHWPSPISSSVPAHADGRLAAVVARALGHPLIPSTARITNDLELRGLGRILIITGSNMSGKSTFLRTLGVNICLAQAGAPVCAASFEWSWVRLHSCIRVDDSLEAGLSFFYAEVKRLKRILDAVRDQSMPAVLFLIDEIFKGTNNRERLIGSCAFLRALASSNGFGLISTHDLELAEMEHEIPHATNAHFQETVDANILTFDYRLRPGPCPTTNALRIMAQEGLPVPEAKDW